MKNKILIPILVPVLIFVMYSCNHVSAEKEAAQEIKKEISKDSLLSYGKYLVNTIGCRDCHSPKHFGPNGVEIITASDLSG
ncbi:hypothetical protein BH11BAC2_BH11BAC2_17280 [soil metagenome]